MYTLQALDLALMPFHANMQFVSAEVPRAIKVDKRRSQKVAVSMLYNALCITCSFIGPCNANQLKHKLLYVVIKM